MPALKPNHSYSIGAAAFSLADKAVGALTHIHLVARLGMSGTILPSSHIPSWSAHVHVCLPLHGIRITFQRPCGQFPL